LCFDLASLIAEDLVKGVRVLTKLIIVKDLLIVEDASPGELVIEVLGSETERVFYEDPAYEIIRKVREGEQG
jgi:hypothetical protein